MKMPELPNRNSVEEAIARYWALAYAEGKEGRDHDTDDGAAQQCWAEIQDELRAYALAYGELVRQECARHLDHVAANTHNAGPAVYILRQCAAAILRDE